MGYGQNSRLSVKFTHSKEWLNTGSMVIKPAPGSGILAISVEGFSDPINRGCLSISNGALFMDKVFFDGGGCIDSSKGTAITAVPVVCEAIISFTSRL